MTSLAVPPWDTTQDQDTALHIAVKEADAEFVTLLLDNGADIQAHDKVMYG